MLAALWDDHTVRTVVLGSAMMGAVSGSLGCFAYLRRQSLIGDVVSHSSLLGIVLAFWLGHRIFGGSNRSLWVLMPGAIVAGLAALLLTKLVTTRTRLKPDAGLGVMLAIFFGTGMMLLRWLQRVQPPIPGRSGLDDYLFGMAAAMTQADLLMIASLGSLAVLTMLATWNRLKVLTFDQDFAAGLGLAVDRLEVLMLALLVVGIVIGLQVVGVVLMIALLVAPAAAARQWTRHLGPMVSVAAAIGSVSAATGACISATGEHLPTGPVIVLLLTGAFLVSIVFAPGRGLITRRRIHVD